MSDPGAKPSPLSTSHPSRIFLVGYRGTGKTSVARILADRLAWSWIDADDLLESKHGRSIRAIFAEEGEAGFRAKEAALVDELCQLQRHVIAAGGGVVLRSDNRAKLRTSGRVVWLSADAATLWQRISRDASTAARRPNLTVGGLAEIEALLKSREPLYRECADIEVSTMARSPGDVADAILKELAAPLNVARK